MPNFTNFNPQAFMETTMKDAQLDTKLPPFPLDDGDEFLFRCMKVGARIIKSKDTGEQYLSFDSTWECMDDNVRRVMNMEHPSARGSFLLDCDEDGRLDIGPAKNVRLGQLLEACGLNTKKGWSLMMVKDCTCYGKVRNRPDADDPERVYPEIIRFTQTPRTR